MRLIETPRLCSEPFASDDAAAAFGWFSDPEVMRFIPTGPDRSMDETKKRLARYIEHHALHGFSKWIVRDRASGRPIGDSGLVVLEDLGKIDLGFRFAKSYWGRGLATEAASAWVRAAFVDFKLDRLTAFAHPENVASLRVLQKLHFRSTGHERVMGMDSIIFSLSAAALTGSCLLDAMPSCGCFTQVAQATSAHRPACGIAALGQLRQSFLCSSQPPVNETHSLQYGVIPVTNRE